MAQVVSLELVTYPLLVVRKLLTIDLPPVVTQCQAVVSPSPLDFSVTHRGSSPLRPPIFSLPYFDHGHLPLQVLAGGGQEENVQEDTSLQANERDKGFSKAEGTQKSEVETLKVEEIWRQTTLSREQCNRLIEVLQTRVVESSAASKHQLHGVEDKGKGGLLKDSQLTASPLLEAQRWREKRKKAWDEKKNGLLEVSLLGGVPMARLKVLDSGRSSPVEVARAYMGDRSARTPGTSLSARSPLYRGEPFYQLSSRTPESLQRGDLMLEEDFCTPPAVKTWGRFPGEMQTLYSRPQLPHNSEHMNELFKESNVSSWWTPAPVPVTRGREMLKRRSTVLDNNWDSFGPIRRTRHKSLGVASEGDFTRGFGTSALNISSPTFTSVGDYKGQDFNINSKLVFDNERIEAASLFQAKTDNEKSLPNGLAFVPVQSSETALKILETLDKMTPSPKGMHLEEELAIGRESHPTELMDGTMSSEQTAGKPTYEFKFESKPEFSSSSPATGATSTALQASLVGQAFSNIKTYASVAQSTQLQGVTSSGSAFSPSISVTPLSRPSVFSRSASHLGTKNLPLTTSACVRDGDLNTAPSSLLLGESDPFSFLSSGQQNDTFQFSSMSSADYSISTFSSVNESGRPQKRSSFDLGQGLSRSSQPAITGNGSAGIPLAFGMAGAVSTVAVTSAGSAPVTLPFETGSSGGVQTSSSLCVSCHSSNNASVSSLSPSFCESNSTSLASGVSCSPLLHGCSSSSSSVFRIATSRTIGLSGAEPASGALSTTFGTASSPCLTGANTTFGLASTPTFGATATPLFAAASSPAFCAATATNFNGGDASPVGASSSSIFGAMSTPALGTAIVVVAGLPSASSLKTAMVKPFGVLGGDSASQTITSSEIVEAIYPMPSTNFGSSSCLSASFSFDGGFTGDATGGTFPFETSNTVSKNSLSFGSKEGSAHLQKTFFESTPDGTSISSMVSGNTVENDQLDIEDSMTVGLSQVVGCVSSQSQNFEATSTPPTALMSSGQEERRVKENS